ncbi:MAG: transcriptional regulator [Chitinophagaceae bacterium]|nr:transcriptional regulator [Chitinophagaceae bacterium]
METKLPYKLIKSYKQYLEYCKILEKLDSIEDPTEDVLDTIDLLLLLIETYDQEQFPKKLEMDPVQMLQSVMKDHKMKAVDLATELDVSKSLISDIIHYRRGFSKELVRKLANRFAMQQEAFNRPYNLVPSSKSIVKK